MALFELRDISISYGKTRALEGISLTVSPGQKVALIGPSGAGKTTLLRTLYQTLPERCAFIHQDYSLVPQLSVFHNVYAGRLDRHSTLYNLRNLVRPCKTEWKAVQQVLERLGLPEKISQKAAALSGGQQQRVAVARALYQQSPVLLADEPVAAVDPHQSGRVLETMLASVETAVIALHSVDLALQFFPRIIGLREGKVFFDLPAPKVTQTRLKDLFLPC